MHRKRGKKRRTEPLLEGHGIWTTVKLKGPVVEAT
jgi:hypothetical protein